MARIECRNSNKIFLGAMIEGDVRIHRIIPGVAGVAVRSEQKDELQHAIDFLQLHPGSWLRFISNGGWVVDDGRIVLSAIIGHGIQIFPVLAYRKSKFDVFELLRAYERTMLAGT